MSSEWRVFSSQQDMPGALAFRLFCDVAHARRNEFRKTVGEHKIFVLKLLTFCTHAACDTGCQSIHTNAFASRDIRLPCGTSGVDVGFTMIVAVILRFGWVKTGVNGETRANEPFVFPL